MLFSLLFSLFCLCLLFVYGSADTLESRSGWLVDLAVKDPLISLTEEMFDNLVLSKPRNYSMIILMTVLESKRNCEPCKSAYEEMKLVTSSWQHSKQKNVGLFFCIVDYDVSPGTFEKLNMDSAPAILYVSPESNIKTFEHMPIQSMGFSAETISSWIASKTSVKIRIFRPPSYTGTVLLAAFMTIAGAALWFRQIDLSIFYNSSLWCNLSLGAIFFGITGQVYNHIRGPPLVHGSKTGEIKAFIYGGSEFQFVAETLIVLFLYLGGTVGIVLVHKSDQSRDRGRKKLYLFAGVALFTLALSLVLSVFRRKYQGYPYSLFFQ